MVFTIFIAFISLIGLIILHELGHFIMARRFGVKVEEFGIGVPPRIFGKKFGETIYSLNLLPLGAFVKLYGEEKDIKDPRSFSSKPIWQRTLIVLAGVVSFWIIAAILISIIAGVWGLPVAVEDEANHNLVNPKVQIIAVLPDSPAEEAGLKSWDVIRQLRTLDQQLTIDKVKEVIEFTEANKGKEVILTIQRGKETFEISLVPRISPSEEGAMGIGLARTALKPYSWYEAPIQGVLVTGNTTSLIILTLGDIISKAIRGIPFPPGLVEVRGPVGIGEIAVQALGRGVNEYLWFVAMISIFLALFNILPIPALDGGKLLFLGIEKIRRKPVPQEIEQKITVFFFFLLIALIIFVTFKDIQRLF